MSYHIESKHSFKELPDRILVREDGWLGGWKFYGEPVVDYWYVRERTCHIVQTDYGDWECDRCGVGIDWQSTDPDDPPNCNFCPNCGAKVIE